MLLYMFYSKFNYVVIKISNAIVPTLHSIPILVHIVFLNTNVTLFFYIYNICTYNIILIIIFCQKPRENLYFVKN